jgi:hypothetical protein
LVREQGKFQDKTLAKLQAQMDIREEWTNAADSYSPHEQSLRIVEKFFDQDLAIDLPASLPPSIRTTYDNDASQFLADHPFVSGIEAINIVFSDYVMAMALVDPACSAAFRSNPVAARLDVGPFFYLFANELAPEQYEGALVPDAVIGKLFTSHRKAQVDLGKTLFIYTQQGEQAILLMNGEAGTLDSLLVFAFNDASGVLEFPTQLSRGTIVTDAGVVLGERGNRFILGPRATITATSVEINAEVVTVDGILKGGRRSVNHIAAGEVTVTRNLKVDGADKDNLRIYGECTWPALRPYVVNVGDVPRIPEASYVDLRAILKAFRQGIGHSPSVFEELMDQRIIKDNRTRQFLLARLIDLGFVSKESKHYYLSTARLAAEGIDWGAFIGGSPSRKIFAFLTQLYKD